jgi:uncharacterized protein involved in outer membrane biogenesis
LPEALSFARCFKFVHRSKVVAVKKVLIGLVGLIVVLIAAVLVVPSVVDWNDYKKEIAAQAKAITGRELVIGGDIKIAVLPAPALRVGDVRLANLAGASSPSLVRLKSLEVRIAFGPLLTGRIEVETVKLVEPVIELEVLADGRKNWEFGTKPGESTGAKPAVPGTPGKSGTAMPAVRLDSFTIEGGTLVYRDAKAGTVERIEAVNAKIAAGSLSGPFESTGSLRARGMPLRFDVTVGKIIEERTMPLTVSLGAGGAKAQVSGTVVNLTDVPRFKGKLKGEGASLAGVLQAVQAGEALPGFLGQAFSVEGNVQASAEGGEVKDLEVVLGDSRATGAAAVKLGKGVNAQAQLAVNRVDLDKWLALAPVGAAPTPPAAGETKGKTAIDVPAAKKPASAPTKAAPAAWQIPNNVAGSFVLSVGAITYRGGVISQTRLKADIADGEITLSQFSTQFPGGSDLAVFGFVNTVKGAPRFEGEAELSIADTRGVIKWLAVEPPPLPADRLRKLKLASKIVATPEQVQFGGLDAQFDGSRLTGGITVALRERPSFGADLMLDKINVDAYLPAPTPKKAGAGSSAPGADKGKAATPAPAASPLDGLKVLGAFDANLKAQVKNLTYSGETIRDVVIDATLFNGALDIRRASVGQAVGASLNVSGGLKGLGSVPEAKGLKIEARVADLARLLAFAKVEAPLQAKGLGAIAATGRLDGNLLAPALDLAVKAAGTDVGVAGKAALLPVPALSGTLKANAADLTKLLAALGVDYRPSGRIGAVSVASAIKASPAAVELTGLKTSAGALAIEGSAQAIFGGAKPKIVADLTASEIAVDPFLPAKKTALLAPSRDGLLVPAAWPGAAGRVDPRHLVAQPAQARRAAPSPSPARRGQWPTEPIDLSALKTFDADVRLKAAALAFDKYRLENADVAAQLANGVLKAERVGGVLFGGALNGTAAVDAGATPKVNAVITLKDADVGRAVQAFAGQAVASGRMSMDLTLATTGGNVAAMVSGLNGNGAVALNRLDVSGAGQGSALAGALGLVASLNQLGGALGGQPGRGAQADITGTFTIDKGVARSTDLKLVSGLGNGQAQGTVDLPRWGIDVSGQIQLAPNLLTQLVDKRAQAPQPVPFQVSGVLDAPNVKLDVSKLPAGLPIPGADRLLQKKGVGKVLEGVLGVPSGQGTAPAQPSQPQAQPQQQQPQPQQQQQRRVRPEDLLKGLFR